jgi:hypothetical protein
MHVIIPDSSETVISLADAYQASASPLFITEMESILGRHAVSFN